MIEIGGSEARSQKRDVVRPELWLVGCGPPAHPPLPHEYPLHRMSKQKIPYVLRHALWMAHGQKCAYCGRPLSFGELEVDHIIPEHFAGNKELPRVLERLEFPINFSLGSTENLLPAHNRCNKKKTDDMLKIGALFFYFSVAKKQLNLVTELVAQGRRENKRENLLAQIADALESGAITHMDIQRENQHPNRLNLSHPLAFVDGVMESIDVEDVPALLDRAVLVGGGSINFATFSGPNDAHMEVRTCGEYRAALAAGFSAISTYDMKMEAFLKTANAMLAAAETIHIPKISFIDTPFRGIADLNLVPASVLPRVGPNDEEDIKAMGDDSLKDLLDRCEIKILSITSQELKIEWRWGLLMRELCRADLDGDGIEDILCECYCWAPGGTLGYGWTSKLTRRSDSEMYSVMSF